MDHEIRPATLRDIDPVYHFICTLEENNFDQTIFNTIYEKNILNSDYTYLVAESRGRITGFISCHAQWLLHHCGKVAEIQELFVDAGYRNNGIGQRLLMVAEETVRKEDCILLEVTAQIKREQTHLFYQTNGFIHTHKKFVKQLQ